MEAEKISNEAGNGSEEAVNSATGDYGEIRDKIEEALKEKPKLVTTPEYGHVFIKQNSTSFIMCKSK